MGNSVSIEEGIENLIDSTGSRREALWQAQQHLAAYQPGGPMANATDADEAREWYTKVVHRLSKMVRK